jgi:tRNA wybutosine-synthesizing protein 3
MAFDMFNKRKSDILSKKDKSHKGGWDRKIAELCEKINSFERYYTTSSCSARVVLMADKDKKQPDLFLKVYHDLISFEKLRKKLENIENKEKDVKFKMEPCALHVACRTFEDAERLYSKAKLAGWKKSGIISAGKRFMVEMNCTERLEFPVIRQGKLLVNDIFLKIVVEDSNKKLKRCWEKIERLKKNLSFPDLI